ncbi:hypothetical protein F0562_021816 [Nyssa sinensis]|uniref:Cupin type-1 domain-containing protein n=1 Tax=Nyssa sinensis TaxID=561372 RepID=A0A5J5BQF0_9ASTE|nr:hypothetical protein F0562_021816 [Nyssa sinensis]
MEMKKRSALLLLALVIYYAMTAVGGSYEDPEGGQWGEREEGEGGWSKRGHRKGLFLLQHSKHVVKTDAGDMRVVKGFGGRIMERPMHIGFITMEPNSLFIPQYLDCSLIIFIHRGEASLGTINKDELVETQLKTGDVYRISAGSPFYLVNTAEGQKLEAICSIDTSESLRLGTLQSFFIGGGSYPTSILAGFNHHTLATAFNVSISELRKVMTRQQSGPIVFLDSHSPSIWTQFLLQKEHQRLAHLKRMVQFEEEEADNEEQSTWSFRNFLDSVFGEENQRDNKRSKSLESYNLYDKHPDYKNNYGWSISVDESDYSPLSHSGSGIYLVNLTAVIKYGIVLRGTGTIQIVFPNGTSAMNAKVKEGDVFWVPRYFPFCQIASQNGPFEFFGFTSSAHKNQPQFLVGRNSILQSMRGSEFAAAFGVSKHRLHKIINAQHESVILPSSSAAPSDDAMWEVEEKMKIKAQGDQELW